MSIRELQASQQPMEVQKLIARMQQIEQELISQTPQLPDALIDIHKMLISHEDMVHLLDDNDIQLLHKCHEQHKQFHLVTQEVKNTKKSKKLTNEDLANL